MRHRLFGKKLNRDRDHRKALFRNLVTSLILHEQIKTTEAKAKAIKGLVDQVIAKGKTGSLHARRTLAGVLTNRQAVEKVIKILTPRFKQRSSGFTRIIRLGRRKGDNASLVRMELVDKEVVEAKKKAKKKKVEEEEKEALAEEKGKAEVKGEEERAVPVTQEVEEKKPTPKRRFRVPRIPSFIRRPPRKA